MEDFLCRYSDAQRKVIDQYWEVIRWTRKHGKVSDRIKLAELDYWSKFEPDTVIAALEAHMSKYPKVKENYTRGIMRNMAEQKAVGAGQDLEAPKPRKRNRFINYTQRDNWDFDQIDQLERDKIRREAEENRDELEKDPRYAKYLRE